MADISGLQFNGHEIGTGSLPDRFRPGAYQGASGGGSIDGDLEGQKSRSRTPAFSSLVGREDAGNVGRHEARRPADCAAIDPTFLAIFATRSMSSTSRPERLL